MHIYHFIYVIASHFVFPQKILLIFFLTNELLQTGFPSSFREVLMSFAVGVCIGTLSEVLLNWSALFIEIQMMYFSKVQERKELAGICAFHAPENCCAPSTCCKWSMDIYILEDYRGKNSSFYPNSLFYNFYLKIHKIFKLLFINTECWRMELSF